MRRLALPLLIGLALIVGLMPATLAAQSSDEPVRPGLSWRYVLDRPPCDEYLPPRSLRVSLEVLVDGRPLRVVAHEGRLYLPVRLGDSYSIRVSNHGSRRIVAVLSVDGLSVITGRPASVNDPGYVVAPGSSIVIDGWRRDRWTVAAFKFTEREKSHAYQIGRPENVGVIGLVAIEEAVRRPLPVEARGARPLTYGKKDAAEVGGTGTGYGSDVHSPVIYVPFVRSSNRQSITLFYDTVENLRRAGIPVTPRLPNPFPADR